jgi:hypothetical protein
MEQLSISIRTLLITTAVTSKIMLNLQIRIYADIACPDGLVVSKNCRDFAHDPSYRSWSAPLPHVGPPGRHPGHPSGSSQPYLFYFVP